MWCSVACIIFLTLESKFVQYTTSYKQLSPVKMTFFGMKCFKILMWLPDECVWCFIFVRRLVCIVALHRTPPPVLNKLTIHHCFQKEILHVCYWSPSVVRAFSILVSSLFPCGGKQTCGSQVKGECIILMCCQICCGQVFIILSWLLGLCERAC